MTEGLIRYQQSGNLHFITFSCDQRKPYLQTAESRTLFEHSLETMRTRYDFVVAGYVIMPEHIHLLIGEPTKATTATAIQAIKLSIARKSPQRPYWLARYYDFNVYSRAKRAEKLEYMHHNPVKRGLVQAPHQWPWSSYHHYATGNEEQ